MLLKQSETTFTTTLPKKPRRRVPFGIGAAVVIVASTVSLGYLYLRGVFSDTSVLASAKVVPDEAMLAGTISTNPKHWSHLQKFGTTEAQQLIGKVVTDLNKQMFTEGTVDYAKDIQPWLGSVMFAILPAKTESEKSDTSAASVGQNYLIVIGIKDKISALSFATKLKSSPNEQKRETEYNGVKIWECSKEKEKKYTALLGDYVVMSPQKSSIESAIDTAKGEPSFASKEGVKSMISRGVDVPNEIAEVYIPESQKVMQQLLADNANARQFTPESMKQLKNLQSVVVGVGIDHLGIRMKAVGKTYSMGSKSKFTPNLGQVISKFPLNTIALVSGYGIRQGWTEAVEKTKNNPNFNSQIASLRQQIKNSLNLDLDKDLVSWMDGEFAVGAFSSSEGILGSLGFSGALVVKANDRKAAEVTLSKLDKFAKNNSLKVQQREIQGKTVTEWASNDQGVLLGHGWLDEDYLFVAIGRPIVDSMASSPKNLENSASFQSVTSALPKSTAGYFYMDMEQIMSVFNSNFLLNLQAPISSEANTILSSIRGIGVTANQANSSTSQMEVLFTLKQKNEK